MTNKTKKYKFNIIDIFIILTIIAIGVVMYYYMSARNTVASNMEVDVEYVVELKTVHKDYLDNIQIGDKVVETVRDQQIGEVVNVSVSPAYIIETDLTTGETSVFYYPPINGVKDELPEEPENDLDDTQAQEEIKPENDIPQEPEEYEFYNVKVTIRDTFKKSKTGYKINAFDLVIGEIVYMRVPHYVGEGYCISIKEFPKEVAKV